MWLAARFLRGRLRFLSRRVTFAQPFAQLSLHVINILQLLAFNAQKFTGSRDRDHAHFLEKFVRVVSGLSLGTHLPNLKFVPSAVLEQTDTDTDRPEEAYQKRQRGYNGYCWTLETGHHAQVILHVYSVQCCYAVHWTDN